MAASAADAAAPAALLAAVAALGVAAAWRIPGAWPAATAGGLAAVAALGGTARPELAPGWAVVTHLALALPLLAAVRVTALPEPVRLGLARAGAGIAGLAALWGCAAAVTALAARLRVLDEVWAATTPAPGVPLAQPGVAAPVALLLAAGAARWLSRVLPDRPEPAVMAVALGWGGLFTAPLPLGLPVAAVLAAQLAVTAAAGLLALRSPDRPTAIAAGAVALLGAGNVSLAALDGRAATFAALGLLGAGCAAGAAYGPAPRWARSGAAALAVGYATALVVALSALTDLAAPWWALPVLAVPAAVTAAGPGLGAQRLAAEAAAGAAGLLALALACGDAPVLALTLALAGVVCAGSAVRADRRALGWAAGVLFVAAAWVRLASAGVGTAEAYTLPVTLPALAVGFLRRRRDPAASSWTAYGPGLAVTLLPSLAAAWGDPHWPRPLLLGGGRARADPGGGAPPAAGPAPAGRRHARGGGPARAGPVRGPGRRRAAPLAAAGPGGSAAARGGGPRTRSGSGTPGGCARPSAACADRAGPGGAGRVGLGPGNARGPETQRVSGPLVRVGDTGFEPVTPSV
ncbi:hypothetical protein GCM10020254_66930 [Streptomyces goshikiensis]